MLENRKEAREASKIHYTLPKSRHLQLFMSIWIYKYIASPILLGLNKPRKTNTLHNLFLQNCFQTQSFGFQKIRIIDYLKLAGTRKDHQVQLPASHRKLHLSRYQVKHVMYILVYDFTWKLITGFIQLIVYSKQHSRYWSKTLSNLP